MITDLKVGDYIEKSELDTEQKYNDVVGVFEQWGFSRDGEHSLSYCNFMNHERENALVASNLVDFDCMLMGCDLDDEETKRKLTYSQVMSLNKVDVDNCNIDKVVSDECFREDPTIKEISKLSKAVLAMESLGHEWDEEKGQWFRKEYF